MTTYPSLFSSTVIWFGLKKKKVKKTNKCFPVFWRWRFQRQLKRLGLVTWYILSYTLFLIWPKSPQKVNGGIVQYICWGNKYKRTSRKGTKTHCFKFNRLESRIQWHITVATKLHNSKSLLNNGCTLGYNDFNNLVMQTLWWLHSQILRHIHKKRFSFFFEPFPAHLQSKFEKSTHMT